jgi:Predicted outer membrane protein
MLCRVGIAVVPLLLQTAYFVTAQQPAEAPKKGTLHGQVVHALTSEPVRRAEVSLTRRRGELRGMMGPLPAPFPQNQSLTAVTDAEGKFVIRDIEPGDYFLSAERNGFVRGIYGARRAGQPGTVINVSAGGEMTGLLLKLMPQAVLAGRLTDEEGEPVQGAAVQVLQKRYVGNRLRWIPAGQGQTNDLGEFRIANISPGQYLLSAAPTRRIRWTGRVRPSSSGVSAETAYARVFYPSVTDPSQASLIEVAPGAEVAGLDMRLQKTRVYRIRGQVLDPSGQPATRALVLAVPSGDNDPMMGPGATPATVESDGKFEIYGVPSGSYTVVAQLRERQQGGMPLSHRQKVEVTDGDVDGVVLTLGAGITLTGSLRVVDGEAKDFDYSRVRLRLVPAEQILFAPPPSGEVKQDGSISIAGISPGKYSLTATGMPQDSYIKSVKVGGYESPDRTIDLSSGTAASLEIVVSLKPAQLSGTIQGSDGAVSGATVVLVPGGTKGALTANLRTTTTDQNGSFTVRGLAPGEYKLFAWEDVEPGSYFDPEFRKPYEGNALTVKLDQGAAVSVTVPPIAAQ